MGSLEALACLLGVLACAFLLGVEVCVVGTVALAYFVSRDTMDARAALVASAGVGGGAVLWVTLVMLIGMLASLWS